MANLDPRIEAVRAKYDLSKDDFWQIPQNKQWVCKHAALEIVAVKAGIEFSLPQIIEANTETGIAVLAVQGTLPADLDKAKGRAEWATGEASPKNNKNAYPWAMAEKRAKDRVVLKLAGIHGLVYSEDEADDFKAGKPSSEPDEEPVQPQWKETKYPLKEDARRKLWASMMDDLRAEAPKGSDAMIRYMQHPDTQRDLATLEPWKDKFRMEAKEMIDLTKAAEDATGDNIAGIKPLVEPNFEGLEP